MRFFTQSTTLLTAIAIVLIIVSTPLAGYMVPILGIVITFSVIFIIIRQKSKSRLASHGQDEELFVGSNKEVFTITFALLLAIFITGGLNSNLFFLLYFLLFGLVFLFEPATVFVLLLGLGALFFQSLEEGDLLSNLIKLSSLAFISPISYFFGREFQKKEKLSREIQDKTGQILEDTETLRTRIKNDEAISAIEDITKKAQDLRREADKE